MTESSRLAAHRAREREQFIAANAEDQAPGTPEITPPAIEDAPEPPPEKDIEDMTDKTAVEETAEYKAGFDAGRKALAERNAAVLASEHYAGREAAAGKLLGKAHLSAEDITDLLADLPKAEAVDPEAVKAAAEEAARKQMAETMQGRPNADLGGDKGADAPTGRAASDAVWDKARAKL